MFDAVLIANRGEIACRIIRTVQRLGARAIAVYSDADEGSRHVTMADAAVRIGPPPPTESYLRIDAIVEAARATGADAVHPGYGFLSERAQLASAVEASGLAFVGPTPHQLELFGSKHATRQLAQRAGVALLAGSGILDDVAAARHHAERVGYPIVLKAVAGGGGIGMRVCDSGADLEEAYASVVRQATASFGDGRLFLERFVRRARHVEVQIFGDGEGRVVVLGDRECSVQRRNQKVVEEAPAPRLVSGLRAELHEGARSLGALVAYRSAGTVEMLIDDATGTASLLEVNARLQVEHPVTEEVTGIDMVEWMLRISAGERQFLAGVPDVLTSRGHAIEARVYAEDPGAGYRPSAGVLTTVEFPAGRVDTWVEAGSEVSSHYDPLLAKLVVHGDDRTAALKALGVALRETRLEGVTTNLDLLRAVAADEAFVAANVWTAWLDGVNGDGPTVEVLGAGAASTVQELPGRIGLWGVGIPPSGPMDDRSFRLGNQIVGNPEETAAIEATAMGPTLRFRTPSVFCIAGAPAQVELDGCPVPHWTAVEAAKGSVLRMGTIGPSGLRTYIHLRGGIDVAPALGSRATFDLGQIGGYGGRALRVGDVLSIGDAGGLDESPQLSAPPVDPPTFERRWTMAVEIGPHASPDFLTVAGLRQLLDTDWEVHHNSSRTGVRLLGPNLEWARPDGGEAGLHPSNIHDTAYAVGSIDLAGDMPIILGPDGPSLGGFVCPATVVSGDRWKIGQLRPGDVVRLRAVGRVRGRSGAGGLPDGVLARWEPAGARPEVTWRRAGDENILVEYGPMTLDLALRFRIHALETALAQAGLAGVVETTAGIRSLQVHVDPRRLSVADTLRVLQATEEQLGDVAESSVTSRVVHLPLSWDDPAVRLATARYTSTVRDDAPWCPWNIEFIRRINGLDSVEDVRKVLFGADYLVMGLGDVYLGAPVATPIDPRHRLVTTKYNPARTWTPENAVGIGGAYLCVYGMEGPGGYQLVGRTVQMWNRYHRTADYTEPWLLRAFDRIRFFAVGPDELMEWRRDLPLGRRSLRIDDGTLRLADHLAFLAANQVSIQRFASTQQAAFSEERARWAASGEFDRAHAAPSEEPVGVAVPPGAVPVESALHASVWQVHAVEGQSVAEGDVLVVLEAMKMELPVYAPSSGHVRAVAVRPGQEILPGQILVVIEPGNPR